MSKGYKHLPKDVIRHVALNSEMVLKPQPDGIKDLHPYIFKFVDNIIDRYLQDNLNEKTLVEKPELTYFPATLIPEEDGDGYAVIFRDIPECITGGKDFAEAIEYAEDALNISKDFYTDRPFPTPSPVKLGDVMIGVKL